MTFEEMLEGVTDENLRKSLKSEYARVNQEKGEHGRKLIEKDQELTTLRNEKKQKSEWETAFNLLKGKGVEVKDIPGILEKMEVQKTTEDENRLLATMFKTEQEKTKSLEKQVKDFQIRTAVDSVFGEVRKEFKNDKGEALVVLDEFIDKAKLYADISDPENKVLLEQRAKEVLTGGLQQQEAIKAKFGFQGAPTFKVPEGNSNPGGQNNIAVELKKIAQEQGPVAALDKYFELKG